MPANPQPRDVTAERLGEQGERDEEGGLGERLRQDVRGRDRQHDPLRRGDDLAPVARRQRRLHPGPHPAGDEEGVACGSDRKHPRAGRGGDVHAENGDQERIDLAVEACAQRRAGPGASHDPSVEPVQRERDARERHQQRDRRGLAEGVRGERRDPDGERGPRERHPVGRAESLAAVADDAACQRRAHDHRARDSDDPAGDAEADGPRERGEQQHLPDQPGQRAGLNRSHRSSVVVGTCGSTGHSVIRFPCGAVTIVNRVRGEEP